MIHFTANSQLKTLSFNFVVSSSTNYITTVHQIIFVSVIMLDYPFVINYLFIFLETFLGDVLIPLLDRTASPQLHSAAFSVPAAAATEWFLLKNFTTNKSPSPVVGDAQHDF